MWPKFKARYDIKSEPPYWTRPFNPSSACDTLRPIPCALPHACTCYTPPPATTHHRTSTYLVSSLLFLTHTLATTRLTVLYPQPFSHFSPTPVTPHHRTPTYLVPSFLRLTQLPQQTQLQSHHISSLCASPHTSPRSQHTCFPLRAPQPILSPTPRTFTSAAIYNNLL